MKKLRDMRLFGEQRETITCMELRSAPGEVLDQVMMGKTIIVTRNGKPVAQITPVESTALELAAEVRRLGLVR